MQCNATRINAWVQCNVRAKEWGKMQNINDLVVVVCGKYMIAFIFWLTQYAIHWNSSGRNRHTHTHIERASKNHIGQNLSICHNSLYTLNNETMCKLLTKAQDKCWNSARACTQTFIYLSPILCRHCTSS